MTHKKKIGTVAYYVVGILIAILAIIPFLWMVSTSLKARGALMSIPIEWIPKEPTVASYVKVFSKFPFFSTIGNSLFISVTYTFITLISASMAAFLRRMKKRCAPFAMCTSKALKSFSGSRSTERAEEAGFLLFRGKRGGIRKIQTRKAVNFL